MLPHQVQWWNLPNYIKLLVGGFGCGKTYIGALRTIFLSCINAPYPVQYISPSYKLAKKTIIPTLFEIMDRNGMRFEYNRTDMRFHAKDWGGNIWIGSGDDPDSLRGPNLAAIGIDEPFIQDKMVFDIAMSRVRHPKAAHREIFLTGTPESLNWGYEVAMNDEGRYDIGVVRGDTRTNIHLPKEYAESMLSGYTPEMVDAYIKGEFVNLSTGRVYKPFNRDKHTAIRTDLRDMPLEIVAGIDFNVDYLTAVIALNGKSFIHFFDEVRLSNSNTYELADELKKRYPGIRVFPDPTGSARKTSATKTDHQILKDHGFTVISKRQVLPKDRVNAVNALLIKDALSVENCPHLVADFEREVWRNGEPDQTTDKARTHASSAAGYLINYLFPVLKTEAWSIRR